MRPPANGWRASGIHSRKVMVGDVPGGLCGTNGGYGKLDVFRGGRPIAFAFLDLIFAKWEVKSDTCDNIL